MYKFFRLKKVANWIGITCRKYCRKTVQKMRIRYKWNLLKISTNVYKGVEK